MPNPILAVGGLTAGAGLIGANRNARAADRASDAQVASAQQGYDEQQRQFDAIREMMSPFVAGGTGAFMQMANLAGVNGGGVNGAGAQGGVNGAVGDLGGVNEAFAQLLKHPRLAKQNGANGADALGGANGADAQSSMLDMIQNDPRLAYAIRNGEDALLANASATGGLRGGNTQRALAELRPALFSNMIDQTYAQLGGLAQMGQASAANTAAAGQSFANNTTALLQQQGAARAGGAMGQAAAFNQGLGAIGNGLGFVASNMPMQAPAGAGLFDRWGF